MLILTADVHVPADAEGNVTYADGNVTYADVFIRLSCGNCLTYVTLGILANA